MKELENKGVHIPILLNAPKQIPYTVAQFDKISIIGLSSLFCNYNIFFCEREDNIEMYMKHHLAKIFHQTKRFEGIKFYQDMDVEIAWCVIPKINPLVKTIEKRYNHLIMR
jgi:hypothetical protein